MKKKIYPVSCILVGALFLASGFGKAMNAGRFGNLIAQYGFEWLQPVAPLIILAEILAGLWLIVRLQTKWAALASLFMLVVFTSAYGYGYFVNDISDCGCFGSMNIGMSGPLFTFARNAVLMGLTVFILINAPKKESYRQTGWKAVITAVILLPSIFLTGYTFRTPEAFWAKRMQHPWLNRPVRDTPLPERLALSADSSCLLLFVSYDCIYCWNSIANFLQIRESGIVDRAVAFAQTGDSARMEAGLPEAERSRFVRFFGDDVITAEIPHNDVLRKHINVWPTFLYLEKDTIRVVVEGVLPSAPAFNKLYIENNKRKSK